jgi:hypothetical protein
MPSRLACVALLFYWLVAAVGLVRRDLLPELTKGAPPDLRTIAAAGQDARPARWTIQVADDPDDPEARRSVGQAVTESTRDDQGWVQMHSLVTFDSGRLIKSMFKVGPAGDRVDEQIDFDSRYRVDPSGNLRSFRADVRVVGQPGELFWVEGRLKDRVPIGGVVKDRVMEVVCRGPLPIFNRTVAFEYHPHAVVQTQFGPLDRLPGLHVGQRWDEQMASPLTGQVETVRAEVKGRETIHWDKEPVSALVVAHRSKAVSARTWVRADGLVLRQEVTLPAGRLRLLLEREPERAGGVPPARPVPAAATRQAPRATGR